MLPVTALVTVMTFSLHVKSRSKLLQAKTRHVDLSMSTRIYSKPFYLRYRLDSSDVNVMPVSVYKIVS